MLSIISIDIGLHTLSVYKEYFDYTKAKTFIIPKQLYLKNGESTSEFKEYVLNISGCGECAFLDKKDLGEKKDIHTNLVFLTLHQYFDDLVKKDIFRDVDVIIIEKQLKINGIASILMYHLHAWCLINFANFKKIILYPSKNKTRVLGAPLSIQEDDGTKKKVNKAFRKKWSVDLTLKILATRKDDSTYRLIFIENKSKKDDLADTITMCLSYHIKSIIK